jgi:DNA repair photolyase
LEQEVKAAIEDGYTVFITEFNEGAGIIFARLICGYREEYPNIYWEAILSRLDQAEQFDRDKWELLSKCNGLRGLCVDCRENYPLSVTRYMIEHAERVIAVRYGEGDHDTLYAMDYALTMGRELRSVTIY